MLEKVSHSQNGSMNQFVKMKIEKDNDESEYEFLQRVARIYGYDPSKSKGVLKRKLEKVINDDD